MPHAWLRIKIPFVRLLYICRNLLSANRAKGHEALCNRLHPNTLCTSKLIEFQSKRLNALLAFLLSQQQSTNQSDVHYTSTSTGNPINGAGPCAARRQTCRHQSTAPLTRHGTIEVDAYYRFLCRKRPASTVLDRCRSTPTVARTVSGESPANWQSNERLIANTNNRKSGRNNEANCCRTDFHAHLDCRSDSTAPPQQRCASEQSDSLETAASCRLQTIVGRIKSNDSTESAGSCEANADVGASLPPANRTVSVDPTKSLIDAFGASAAPDCRRLHGASRQRACCTRPRLSPKAQQATIEQAIRLTQLVKSSTATAKRSAHSATFNAENTMNFNAGNASDDKHPHNFQLACRAAHCNALSRQEYQQATGRQPQLLHQQHSQAVNYNYYHCYSIGVNSASGNNNNPIEAGNGVNNNVNSWSAAAATTAAPFGCVDRLIDTFNGSLNLTPADNRGQLPQITLSDFSGSATGPVSAALLFTRAAAVQTLAEHPIVIDTPTTTPASIYPPM